MVQRIGVHLTGAQIFLALARRLDTPTASSATAAATAAVREGRSMDQTNAAVTPVGTKRGAAPGVSDNNVDDHLHEEFLQDQTADAEVLPREWNVADGAAVYDSRDGKSDRSHSYGNSPYGRRNRQESHGNGAGTGWLAGARRQRRADRHEEKTEENTGRRARPTRGEDRAWPESSRDKIRWREITKQPFDLLLLVDTGDELGSARTLLSMPEYGVEEQERAEHEGRKPGGIYICPTMAEYYLLLSVYFGENIHGMLPGIVVQVIKVSLYHAVIAVEVKVLL